MPSSRPASDKLLLVLLLLIVKLLNLESAAPVMLARLVTVTGLVPPVLTR